MLFRTIAEFALEYRTTRERVLVQLEKKASHRERNKTRGKMITDVSTTAFDVTRRYFTTSKSFRFISASRKQLMERQTLNFDFLL